MIVLPIVDRELRMAARRAVTYRTRLWAALGAMLLATWKSLGLAWQSAPMASQGRSLFYTLSVLAFVYCLFIGARVTADCLSEEKREGTLGLLFLTDLKALDVVLGKLVASSLNSFYGLLAVLPLLAMPLLLGGVTLAEFGRIVLVLLNTLVFSLSVGMFISAISRNERRAIFGTALAVVSPAAIPFCVAFYLTAVAEVVESPADLEDLIPWLMANPVYAFVWSLPRPPFLSFPLPEWSFWFSLGAVHFASWVLLAITALILPAVWKDRARPAKPEAELTLAERWRLLSFGNADQRSALRFELLGRNPFLWLVSRDRLKPAYAWLFLVSMVGVWAWGYWQHSDVMFDFYPLVPTIMLIHTFLKVWVVAEVSHRVVEDQRNGALELLLSTPLAFRDIVRGQGMALLRQFGRPVLALCVLEIVVFQSTYSLRVILPVEIILIADLFTLFRVALPLSLGARSINEVLLKSFLWVLILPWAVYLVAWPIWEWAWRHLFLVRRWHPEFQDRLYLWFFVGLVIDAVLVLRWASPQWLDQFLHGGSRREGGPASPLQKWLPRRLKTTA